MSACRISCASPKFCPALKSTASSAPGKALVHSGMFCYVGLGLGLLNRYLQSHGSLLLENLALRQQLAVLKRKHPRLRMGAVDKIFWVFARRFWGAWKQSLVLIHPETVVRWHRAGFRLYWSFDLQSETAIGKESGVQGGQRFDLSNGGGGSDLGRSSHSRRTAHARLRGFRENHLPLDQAGTSGARGARNN